MLVYGSSIRVDIFHEQYSAIVIARGLEGL
jgi:hypothetical protein